MKKYPLALFLALAFLDIHGQGDDSTTVITNAPCVDIFASTAQNDVVLRVVIPPLVELNAETETIQLTNSSGDILPYYKGQDWADSSEVWVRFDSLPAEESLFFLSNMGYSHVNDPHQVFDLYDSFDSSNLDEDIWSSSVQSGASFNVGNGELSMNVTQTDNYCSIYSNQSFDLSQNWAIHLQARTQDNRGHVCMAIGSGYDAGRLENGGYAQLNGYGIGESHHVDWQAQVNVNGNGLGTEYVGEDLSYAPMVASWTNNQYRIFISGSLASTIEVGVDEKPSGEYPFFIWLNGWDANNRSLWLDFVAVYLAAEGSIQVGESGCLEPHACNYNPAACTSDESCDFTCCPGPGCCHDGTTWDMGLQKCVVANPSDSNFDGCVQLNDLLDLLSAYGDCGAEEPVWQYGDPLEYQGYEYETVQIGEQFWFAENLRAENYQNGDAIQSNLSVSEWATTMSGAVAVYGEVSPCTHYSPDIDACDPTQSLGEYGRLYNWHAVEDARGLCPSGWHVSTDGEWMTIEMALGLSEAEANDVGWRGTNQGTQMKTTTGWYNNGNGSNAIGFSGLPGSRRYYDGSFDSVGINGVWWTSSLSPNGESWGRYLGTDFESISRDDFNPKDGFSVRCVRDAE